MPLIGPQAPQRASFIWQGNAEHHGYVATVASRAIRMPISHSAIGCNYVWVHWHPSHSFFLRWPAIGGQQDPEKIVRKGSIRHWQPFMNSSVNLIPKAAPPEPAIGGWQPTTGV